VLADGHGRGGAMPRDPRPDALPSPRQLAWTCVRGDAQRTASERAAIERIQQDAEVARGVTLIERFGGIEREHCVTHGAQPIARCGAIVRWLEHREIPSVQTFAAGLQQGGVMRTNRTAMRFARP
jgi:hypothetical protein